MLTRIDHVMICVGDLHNAIDAYTRLGFDVYPGGVHAGKGTHNAIAFNTDGYLELTLGLAGAAWANQAGPFDFDTPQEYDDNFEAIRRGAQISQGLDLGGTRIRRRERLAGMRTRPTRTATSGEGGQQAGVRGWAPRPGPPELWRDRHLRLGQVGRG